LRSWLNTIQPSCATAANQMSSVVSCLNLNLFLGSSWYSTKKAVGRAARITLLVATLLITTLLVARLAAALAPRTARLAAGRSALRHARHGTARLVAAKYRRAHRIEKTARRFGLQRCAIGALQFLDMGIGGFKRLVLHQNGLHQRIGGVRCAAKPFPDHSLGVRIARAVFERCKAVKQLADKLAFLRCHVVLLGPLGAKPHLGRP